MDSLFFNSTRLLVVEDDLSNAERIAQNLRSAGYYVQNAYSANDALAIDHKMFHLALVNAEIRDRSGKSVVDAIQQHSTFSELPILFITDDDSLQSDDTVLLRPFSDQELLRRVELMVQQVRSETRQKKWKSLITEDDIPTEPTRITFDAHLQQQLAELKTLSNLGRSISSVLELNEVLNQIVEAATTLTRAEEGMLLLPDEEGKALYLRAMKGLDDRSAHNFRVKAEDPLIGRVFMTGEPVLIGDRGLQRVKTEYFVKSLLYVPMTFKGQTMGVLGVNNRALDRVFTKHDQELLLDLAAHAAIAIENAKLYEERLLQNRQLGMLIAAAKAVNSTLALSDVLAIICQQMIQTLEVNVCLITQQEPDTEALTPLAGARRAVWRPEQGPSLPLSSRPILQHALDQNAFYAVTRKQRDISWQSEQEYLQRDGATQMIVLPVRPGSGPAVAILELFYHGSAPEVTSDFRASMRTSATEILAMVTDRTSSLPTYNIYSTAQKILDTSYASWMALSLIQARNSVEQSLIRVVEYGAAVFLSKPTGQFQIFPQRIADFGEQTVINHHIREDILPDNIRAAMVNLNAEAMLSLPIMIKGSPFGAVTIFNTTSMRRFRQREVSLALALVTQAATAIENARLYNDLEQSLSELRQAQAKLVQTARLSTMGELAAVVAHQINNPLTTIMVDSELILQEIPPEHSHHEGVTAINRAGKRAHAVVKRLLSTARRSTSEEPLQQIEVHETIYNTLDLVTTHIERSKIRIDVKLDTSRPGYVKAVPGHLEDLWLNLLLNAHDALVNTRDALISIHSFQSDKRVEVSICDNGPGIPLDILENIFDPFFTTKPSGEGTGLGLYICKQIVDQCKGTIRVGSQPGEGACFWIELPLVN